MSKPVKFTIAGVVLVALAAVGAMGFSKRGKKAVEVRMEQVERRDLVASVTASGQVQPRTAVDVSVTTTELPVVLAEASVAVRPAGAPVIARPTAPVKFVRARLTVAVPVPPPAGSVTVVGVTVTAALAAVAGIVTLSGTLV